MVWVGQGGFLLGDLEASNLTVYIDNKLWTGHKRFAVPRQHSTAEAYPNTMVWHHFAALSQLRLTALISPWKDVHLALPCMIPWSRNKNLCREKRLDSLIFVAKRDVGC